MIEEPVFSIIIPLYNRAERIKETIDSCISQSFENFEIIIIDDGSTDNPEHEINLIEDSRIFYYKFKNQGGAVARNRGIDIAKGKYIAFLDSDDKFYNNKLSVIKDNIDIFKSSHSAYFSKISVNRGSGNIWHKPDRLLRKNERVTDFIMADRGFVQTSSLVVETKIAKLVRFSEGLPFGQDTDFVIRLERYGVQFKMIDDILIEFDDAYHPMRVSNGSKYFEVNKWLNSMRRDISSKAFYTYRAFHLAKLVRDSNPKLSFKLYFSSLVRFKLKPKMAFIIACQLILTRNQYRRVVDSIINIVGHFKVKAKNVEQ